MARLEEQLSLLITKMNQQGEQLEQLTSQQSERVESVVTKLKETDKHIDDIAGNLNSVKTEVHGRFGEMESSVTNLKVLQEELGERQKALKVELRDDLFQELSVSISTLRPSAPPFIPKPGEGSHGEGGDRSTPGGTTEERSATVSAGHGEDSAGIDTTTPGSGEGVTGIAATAASVTTSEERGLTATRSTMQKLAPFDGKLTWDAYHTQFETLVQINRWSDVDKAAYLAISLRGPAATVLTNLPPGQRQNYASLTSALQARFGTAHQTELNRMKLKGRTRRREETLPELAEDVERLVRLSYPDATEPMVEVLAKDQFVDSLPDEDMRLRIRQHRPATLRAALETALELESYQLASKQRTRFVKEIQLEEHPMQQVLQSSARGTVATGDVLQHLVDALGWCCKEFKTPTSTAARKQTTRTNLVC